MTRPPDHPDDAAPDPYIAGLLAQWRAAVACTPAPLLTDVSAAHAVRATADHYHLHDLTPLLYMLTALGGQGLADRVRANLERGA